MKTIYRLEATNFKTTNPDINTVTLFFENKVRATDTKVVLENKGYKCSKVYEHREESGCTIKDTVDYVNSRIGS